MIMGVVKCYIGGLTAMIFGGGSTSFGGHDDSTIVEESGLPFGVHNIIIKVTVSLENLVGFAVHNRFMLDFTQNNYLL